MNLLISLGTWTPRSVRKSVLSPSADDPGDRPDHLARRREPDVLGIQRRDGRGDLAELVVVGLLHARVQPEDEIRLQRGDVDELEAVVQVQQFRLGGAERGPSPWPDPVGLVAVPVGDGDRGHPQRRQEVLLGVAGRDSRRRQLFDRRLAVCMRDRHRSEPALFGLWVFDVVPEVPAS
jgi:hypothetical protein